MNRVRWDQSARMIPAPLTPLIGRERELTTIVEVLHQGEARLLTITGPGGVGKTRLAQEAARELSRRMRDGAVFVDLTVANDPEMVIEMIAYAIGINVRAFRDLEDLVARELGDRELLLVLDNFEHVISAGTEVASLLVRCPGVKALVTSQMPLHVRGERELLLSPLEFPTGYTPDSIPQLELVDAVQLFVQRAQAVQPRFRITGENAWYVAEICRRLDGLPLALELAAARIKVFPVSALHDRLADRMNLLTGGARDLPERLQTMRNALLWSYDLLTSREQSLFRALAVFQGSFSLDAAVAVSGWPSESPDGGLVTVLDGISSLVDKSMVVRDARDPEEARFRMLETIREFGLEQAVLAGEDAALSRRHLQYFAATAPGEIELAGPEQATLLERIDEDLANIRYALQSALNFGGEAAVEGLILASSMWRYWMSRGQFVVGRYWLETLLERTPDGGAMIRGRAENNLGNLVLEMGDFDAARASYERAMELYEAAGYLDGVADELNNLGLIRIHEGDYAAAREVLERSLAIRERTGDRTSVPTTLSNLGDVHLAEGDTAGGAELHFRAYEIRMELGNDRGVALSCYQLGIIAILRRDWEDARGWFARGTRIANRIGDAYSQACLKLGGGLLQVHDDDAARAIQSLRAALTAFQEMSAWRMMLETINGIGHCGAHLGHDREAVELISACYALNRTFPMNGLFRRAAWVDEFRARLRARLGEKAYVRAERVGSQWTIDDALDAAVALLDAMEDKAARRRAASLPVPGEGESPAAELPALTRRQLEVLRLLALGRSDKEIAEELSISPRTVMTHVGNILAKLKVNRRSAASSIAIRAGLIPPPDVGDPGGE